MQSPCRVRTIDAAEVVRQHRASVAPDCTSYFHIKLIVEFIIVVYALNCCVRGNHTKVVAPLYERGLDDRDDCSDRMWHFGVTVAFREG